MEFNIIEFIPVAVLVLILGAAIVVACVAGATGLTSLATVL